MRAVVITHHLPFLLSRRDEVEMLVENTSFARRRIAVSGGLRGTAGVFALPSRVEGMPSTLTRAMEAGGGHPGDQLHGGRDRG